MVFFLILLTFVVVPALVGQFFDSAAGWCLCAVFIVAAFIASNTNDSAWTIFLLYFLVLTPFLLSSSLRQRFLSAKAAASKAYVENSEALSRHQVCDLCKENLPRKAFDTTDGNTHLACRQCWPYVAGGLLTAAHLELIRSFADQPADPEPETTTKHHSPAVTLADKHFYVIGKSGSGKTTLLKRMAFHDLTTGAGFAFIDPHGDAVADLLEHVPDSRLDDLIYFDPTSADCPSFNLLALPYRPDKLVVDLVSLFKLFFGASWGQQLEMLLTNGLTTLIADREHEPHSLADLRQLLRDEDYRETITARISDSELRDWWQLEYPTLAKTAANPVLNRLNAFMPPLSPLARLFAQRENDLDFTAILNQKKILLANLSKGELGNEPSRLLGGMLAASIAQAALARSATPEAQRVPFHLYADEFQTYVVESFEMILSEARKYRLTLALANQTLAQLPTTLKAAVFGNIGGLVAFCVAADDATQLKKEMRSSITVQADGTPFDRAGRHAAAKRALTEVARELLTQIRFFPLEPGAPPTLPHTRDTVCVSRATKPGSEFNATFKSTKQVIWDLENCRDGYLFYRLPDLKEVEYPSVHDFLTLRPLHAFARVGGADQVSDLRVDFLPSVSAERAAFVRAHLHKKKTHTPPPPPDEEESVIFDHLGRRYKKKASPDPPPRDEKKKTDDPESEDDRFC